MFVPQTCWDQGHRLATIKPRLVIGSIIIKHLCNLEDRETIDLITENMCIQYFLGYLSFAPYAPFAPSLFVEFRKRLGPDNLNAINERIVAIKARLGVLKDEPHSESDTTYQRDKEEDNSGQCENRGRVIFYASIGPQDNAYPTDLDLLSDAREKTEELIGKLYRNRFGCYPQELLADQIYCTRVNRAALKEKGTNLKAKPLGRPPAVLNHVRPEERNLVEGKLGHAETAYGLNCIRARLQNTSESWIASIILEFNLVKLAGVALHCLIGRWVASFSADPNYTPDCVQY